MCRLLFGSGFLRKGAFNKVPLVPMLAGLAGPTIPVDGSFPPIDTLYPPVSSIFWLTLPTSGEFSLPPNDISSFYDISLFTNDVINFWKGNLEIF